MANPGHAKLSPSKAHSWMVCPGSIRMSEGLPDEAGEAAARGTACHAALHDLLLILAGSAGGYSSQDFKLARAAHNLSEDEAAMVAEVAAWVEEYLFRHPGATLETEVALKIYGDDCWGTADIVLNSRDEIVVADAKFGFNEVEVHDNPQLLSYLLGALGRRADNTRLPCPKHMRVAVLQPQCGEPKVAEVFGPDVSVFEDRLYAAIEATREPDAPLRASADACKWCPAAAVCPENQKQALAIARGEFAIIPERLTPEQVAEILHKAKAIKQAVAAVEDHALNELKLGRDIPGWKRVAAKTHRQWREGAEKELVAMVPLLDADPKTLYDPAELKSPAQAEKLLKLKPGALDSYTLKPEGGPVLVPDSDPRPALAADFELVLEPHKE